MHNNQLSPDTQQSQPQSASPRIEIDPKSGFCFGVVNAIKKAEDELAANSDGTLYCLGDIVHNSDEVERLRDKGLRTINHDDMASLSNVRVLLRAHGEPPETYRMADDRGIEIIDATCPVVLKLQQRIKATCAGDPETQIVIYGKLGHAEVNGLVGQTDGRAIVIENDGDLDRLDYSRPIALYSQTTKSIEGFNRVIEQIRGRLAPGVQFDSYDTICRSVSGRVEHLRQFAGAHSVILFVAGTKSSNGKILFGHCRDANPRSYLVPNADALEAEWLRDADSIGIAGATSTPRWLMERVRDRAAQLTQTNKQ